jgi:hypothetical protein
LEQVFDSLFSHPADDLIRWQRRDSFMDQDVAPPAQARRASCRHDHPLAAMVLQKHLVAGLYPQLCSHKVRQFDSPGLIECCFHGEILG